MFGRLIRMGVSSVASPLHPFGGVVDIIVVEQQDGTYRSTPWYVQFGKFQGVLKGAEKIVTISVNGVEANFHMYLDNSGQAHFLREVVPGREDIDSNNQDATDFGSLTRSDGDELGNTSFEVNDLGNIEEEHQDMGDESEVEADDGSQSHESQDVQIPLDSPDYGHCTHHQESFDEMENLGKSSEDSNSEMLLMSVDGHFITAAISKEEKDKENIPSSVPQLLLGSGDTDGEDFGNLDSSPYKDLGTLEHENKGTEEAKGVPVCGLEEDVIRYVDIDGLSKDRDMFKSCLDLIAHTGTDDSQDVLSAALDLEMKEKSQDVTSTDIPLEGENNFDDNLRCQAAMSLPASDVSCNADMPERKDIQSIDRAFLSNCDLPYAGRAMNNTSGESKSNSLHIENTVDEDSIVQSVPSQINIIDQKGTAAESSPKPEMPEVEEEYKTPNSSGLQRISRFGFEISLCGNLLHPGMGRAFAAEVFELNRISEKKFKASGPEIIKNDNLIVRYEEEYYPWDKVAHIIVGITLFGSEYSVDPTSSIPVDHVEEHAAVAKDKEESGVIPLPTFFSGWRLWSLVFRRRMQETKSLLRSSSNLSDDEVFLDAESCFQSTYEEQTQSSSGHLSPSRNFLRTNIPTNEQISSLNLKDGQNTITFCFSTRVFGKQQVSAHIYLWKWNAKIVISDVDGTITRSDVLGQIMPLVGKDWTQSGVASLFSAIKENGYQLLFLSARAIVQSYLTKSFLTNVKQDGKILPIGPVVISPDGLLPSLYREVIRRAPHEFKIACLKDIRSLFPSDHNPFYAGFGNRDTDELTYKKIGIPEGKIFIINPKGEIALYNHTNVKSYTSLHALVNDMFPPTSLAEQDEEYNCWNYWKLPPASID